MVDNAIYQLGGQLTLNSMEYQGLEEPAVFSGSARIGRICVTGLASGLGFQNNGEVTIDNYQVGFDSSGNSPAFLFRIRDGSTNAGRITFGSITGVFRGTSLMATTVGTLEYLTINHMYVRFRYNPTVATPTSSWMNITSAQGVDLRNCHVEVIDETSTSTNTLVATLNPSISKASYILNFDLNIYKNNNTEQSGMDFRINNAAQELIETKGVRWRTDIGPYIVNNDNVSGSVDDTSNGAPTSGAWRRGKRLLNASPVAGGFEGWVCVVGGSSSIWKQFGTIEA
jgi:hypothetical protein